VRAFLFEAGQLSKVHAVELDDGRKVVVKVRPWATRLVGCLEVQRRLVGSGFPCPRPLTGVEAVGDLAVSAETLVAGGEQLSLVADRPVLFASLFARMLALAPPPEDVGPVDPPVPWTAWDHDQGDLWPSPDVPVGDLNTVPGPAWLDHAARRARERLAAYEAKDVVGHGDFESQNIRWVGEEVLAVHDWDSVVARPEAALVGVASAVFTATGGPGAASIEQSEAFIAHYEHSRGSPFTTDAREAAWAAGLWVRAFNAEKKVAQRLAPDVDLTDNESDARLSAAHA